MNPINVSYPLIVLVIGAILAVGAVVLAKKSGTRKTLGWIGVIGIVLAGILFLAGVSGGLVLGGAGGLSTFSVSGGKTTQSNDQPLQNSNLGTNGQNPLVQLVFADALTNQAITALATNIKDVDTGRLLGAYASTTSPQLISGQTVQLLANASGYITQVTPAYQVVNGAQQIQGSLYKFANETIQLYNNTGTALIGGTLGTSGNDSSFTTQANLKMVLTGTTFKSSGRIFMVYETTSTTNVSAVTLTQTDSTTPIASASVPNCYTNTLTTPYRVAWELPAIVGGQQQIYNLQIVSANGNKIQGAQYLTLYNEQDAYDSLTGAILTRGICDSNNANTFISKQVNNWYFN